MCAYKTNEASLLPNIAAKQNKQFLLKQMKIDTYSRLTSQRLTQDTYTHFISYVIIDLVLDIIAKYQ